MTETGWRSGQNEDLDNDSLTKTKSEDHTCTSNFDFSIYKFKIEDYFARKCYQSVLANSQKNETTQKKTTKEIGI